jgi:hypothetical protein
MEALGLPLGNVNLALSLNEQSCPKATLTANSGSQVIGVLDSYQRLLERIQRYWGPL